MRPIAIDDFCAVRSLANVTFSPEGTTACFTVSQAKKEKNCYDSRLYTLKDGVVRALTSGGRESSFCYLDENTVLFAADREGEKEPSLQSRFYRIALDGGEAELAYTFPIPVSQVFPLPGGDLLHGAAPAQDHQEHPGRGGDDAEKESGAAGCGAADPERHRQRKPLPHQDHPLRRRTAERRGFGGKAANF